jgi:hypothetical protein
MQILTNVLKISIRILVIAVGIVIIAFLGCSLMIGRGVSSASESATAQFYGDRVEALIALVDCQTCDLHDRTTAVWALGQLKDKRALPILYKYRTGKPCDHLHQICQYEITKAIRWTEGNSYMLPQIWRVMLRVDRGSVAKSARHGG